MIGHRRRLILGIDGGGSKTLALLADADGRVLGRGTGPTSNYQTVGAAAAQAALDEACAAAFLAASLPPAPLDLGQEGENPHYIEMTLDFLVDELADAMHAERKVRAAFNRDIGNKVLFIKEGKLLFIKGIKLKAIADRKAYFASLRARQAQPIVILAELPPEQAFDLWQQHVLGDRPD